MPTEIEPDAIATHAPQIAALAEQLEMEAESALLHRWDRVASKITFSPLPRAGVRPNRM